MDYKTLLNLYLPEIFLTICALFTLFYSFSRKKRTFPIFLLLSYGFLIYFDYKNLSLYFEELLPFIILIDGFTFIILYLFYLREKGENFVITNFLIFLHLLAIHILLKTESLSIFFLSIELLSFVFYILIGIESKKIRDFGPLLRYFMLGSFSSVILLFSIILIYSQTGTFSFEGFSFSFENPSIFKLALFLFFFALGFKILFIPFQFFLPDVFSRLSFPYIALISLTPKAGIIVFLYKLKLFLPEIIFPITVFAILTLLITNFVGIFDEDVKRVIAYSSISHSSFLFIILLLHEPFLSKILLFYLISYFVMKGGLFYSLHPFYEFEKLEFKHLKGLYFTSKFYSFSSLVFIASLFSFPPTIGFFATLTLLYFLSETFSPLFIFFLIILKIISVGYYIKFLNVLFLEPSFKREVKGDILIYFIISILFIFTIIGGIFIIYIF